MQNRRLFGTPPSGWHGRPPSQWSGRKRAGNVRRRDKLKRAAARLAQSNGRLPVKRRRGPREAQEIIRALFAARPSEAFLTKDLCEIIHPKGLR